MPMISLALAMGCDGDGPSDPTSPPAAEPTIQTLAVQPSHAVISLNEPSQAVQLKLDAYDVAGQSVGVPGTLKYTSDAPAVATVTSGGLVTGIAAGTATITAAVSEHGVSRSASMVVTVTRPRIASLSVQPSEAALLAQPGQTLQLAVEAYDEARTRLRSAPTFVSDAPTVAKVSSTGVVEAVGPGTATITASLTISGVTRSDAATITVVGTGSGVYDLTATVTSFDPAWGYDMAGNQYTATLSFGSDAPPTSGIVGAFSDLRLTGTDIEPHAPMSGVIIGRAHRGRIEIELEVTGGGNSFHLSLLPDGAVFGPVMHGMFGCCGHVGGSFTAARRAGS
jgi:hypothetical protein